MWSLWLQCWQDLNGVLVSLQAPRQTEGGVDQKKQTSHDQGKAVAQTDDDSFKAPSVEQHVLSFVYQPHSWQPGIKNPHRGLVLWQVPENLDIAVTLFKVWRSAWNYSYDTSKRSTYCFVLFCIIIRNRMQRNMRTRNGRLSLKMWVCSSLIRIHDLNLCSLNLGWPITEVLVVQIPLTQTRHWALICSQRGKELYKCSTFTTYLL